MGKSENHSLLDAILCLPYQPETIYFCSYLEKINSKALLDWLLDKFLSENNHVRLHILVSDTNNVNQDAINKAAEQRGVNIIKIAESTLYQAIIQVSKQIAASNLAIISPGFGFAPSDLLKRVFSHHLEYRNDFTHIIGFPKMCVPEIYKTEILQVLSKISFPFAPVSPFEALDYIFSLNKRNTSHNHLTLSKKILIQTLKLLTNINKSMSPFKSVPFNASSAYGLHGRDLPNVITLEYDSDVKIAEQVINSRLSKTDVNLESELDSLLLWKQVKQEQESQFRFEVKKSINNIHAKGKNVRTSEAKRILYVSSASGFTGGEESLCQLTAALDSDKYEKHALVSLEGYFAQKLREANVSVICPNQNIAEGTVNNFLYLLSVLNNIRPDIVHFNSDVGMPALIASHYLGIPTIQHIRVFNIEGSLLESLKTSQAIIAISEFTRRIIYNHGVTQDNVHVIHNGIDLEHFRPGSFNKLKIRQEFNLPLDAKIVVMIARYAPNKRYDLIIKAAGILNKTLQSFHLVLVGGDQIAYQQNYEMIKRQISETGLTHCTSILGFQGDIRRIEAAADVVVLCSDREPWGRCIAEAMAMGVPVVVTDSDGKQEIVENNVDGLVAPSGNYTELAAKISKILTDDSLVAKFTKAARKKMEMKFSISSHAREIENIYNQVFVRPCY